MESLPYIVLVLLAGLGVPLQTLINGRLSGLLASAVWASVVSFAVGLLGLLALQLLLRAPLPAGERLAAVPWWAWLGGLLGGFFIAVTAFAIPRLGAGALTALIILGQLLGALALDHFGVLQAGQPLTWLRAAGAALLLAGAWLIVRP